MGKTLFDKIWDAHIVNSIDDGPDQIYIDRHYCHEVTTPQAFDGLRRRGLKVMRPERTTCSPDHNIPTIDQDKPIAEPTSARQVQALVDNAREFGLEIFGLMHPLNGIIHVMGPENGLTLPGATIVCGDSHTSTHGAFGAVAFGIGTSEVEMVLATQCILQQRPRTMRIRVDGRLNHGVTAKDVILYIIAQLGTGGATGHFVEYAGSVFRNMSMEERMTVCNMSIEMGARGGMIAPDETTIAYLRNCRFAPKGEEWTKAVERWSQLYSDSDAQFDTEIRFDAADIEPRITYGTNPGMGIGITETVPGTPAGTDTGSTAASHAKALGYMRFEPGRPALGTKVDYVFLGSCTNGRAEDFRAFANMVRGRKKHPDIVAWLVPGSWSVRRQLEHEGIDKILSDAGFELRQPGCSACLAMNEDKIPAGALAISTSNRNFEGRQGSGARTVLTGPLVAAAAAVTGMITDPRTLSAE